jgi:hypothetical protein
MNVVHHRDVASDSGSPSAPPSSFGASCRSKSGSSLSAKAFNEHPWPPPGRRNRLEAVHDLARDCMKRGYPPWHALLAVGDWNFSHPPALDAIETAECVTRAYMAAPEEPDLQLPESYLRLSEHCSPHVEPRSWLVPDILPAGQRTALVGRWGTGKSWLALDLAMAVVFGSPFLGDTLAATRGPVVILDAEGGGPRAVNRFNQLRIGRGIPARSRLKRRDIHWFSLRDFNLSWEDAAGKLAALVAPIEPVLIVMDTLAKVMGMPDENSNAAAARVTRGLCELNQTTSAALLLLAHPAKTESGDASVRGAGELSADLDVLWTLQRSGEHVRKARCDKDRDPDLENSTFAFSINSWKNGTRLSREETAPPVSPVEAAIMEALHASPSGLKRSHLTLVVKEKCNFGRTTALDAVARLSAAGRLVELDHRLYLAESP